MSSLQHAPVLSTPAEFILEQQPTFDAGAPSVRDPLTQEQFVLRYEIQRTVKEIREQRWRRVALQFPDHMLHDSIEVFNRLKIGLAKSAPISRPSTTGIDHMGSSGDEPGVNVGRDQSAITKDDSVKLMILGDTSYGACCVDEVAAEHMDADGVVHYGRSCLSPTQRLPVIYVYTTEPLDDNVLLSALQAAIPDKKTPLCILADSPWQRHISGLTGRIRQIGYDPLTVDVVHSPSETIPNRVGPDSMKQNPKLWEAVTILHIGQPPTSLILTLKARVKDLYVFDPQARPPQVSLNDSAQPLLRRRYAALLRIATAPVIGILVNTLSVNRYLDALKMVQERIAEAGKKSYTFVVGKLNPAKLANFAEIGGWVVISCWESSLVDSRDFLQPVITPYELELALMKDDQRIWSERGWHAGFDSLLDDISGRRNASSEAAAVSKDTRTDNKHRARLSSDQDQQDDNDSHSISSDDEPPEFDLRTGRLVSHSRPIRSKQRQNVADGISGTSDLAQATSRALTHRIKGELATINGVVSPGAEYLRTKREWQGLGSDFQIEYERDEQGNIQGATMEEGRSGVAKGYNHSQLTGST